MGLGTAASQVFRQAAAERPPLRLSQSPAAFGTALATWDETPFHSQTKGTGREPHVHRECIGPRDSRGRLPPQAGLRVHEGTFARDRPLCLKSGRGKEGMSRTPSRGARTKASVEPHFMLGCPTMPATRERAQRMVRLAAPLSPRAVVQRMPNQCCERKKAPTKTDLCCANCQKPCPASQTSSKFLAFRCAQKRGREQRVLPLAPYLKERKPDHVS